jgi:S-adenosylmethionine:tRNA ribosyltransferase-isomerase
MTDTRPRELELTLLQKSDDGVWLAEPSLTGSADEVLQRFGTMPLPPYIRRPRPSAQDWLRYQTTFARSPGAVAAPTAGLHFTPELLAACRERGIEQTFVTLHVGIGTFRPIAVERLSDHRMHSEWCELSVGAASLMNQTRQAGGRIVAVGTTAVRTLETAAAVHAAEPVTDNPKRQRGTNDARGLPRFGPWQGPTDLFIRPPYEFRSVDALLTNFHLPRSTLLVLVSAFAGNELIRDAYQAAIADRYRFYSYGDAMLIL